MNTTLKIVLIALAVVVVGGSLFFAGQMAGRWQTVSPFGYRYMPMMNRGAGRGWDNGYGYGPGYTQNVEPVTIAEAKQAADTYLKNLGNVNLISDEVMVFDNNAYVVIKEKDSGLGAFELLVDPVSKVVYPEHGPNMMWNLKYGAINHNSMMSGRGWGGMMMGAYAQNWANATPSNISSDMPVTEQQAIDAAQEYLDRYLPSHTAATNPVKFYGYYTLDFEKDGKVVGMLSVNGYNGDIFLHTWHGTFIEETE